eukprot:367095-Lingulodinium_polyedra.AAC.1
MARRPPAQGPCAAAALAAQWSTRAAKLSRPGLRWRHCPMAVACPTRYRRPLASAVDPEVSA